MASLRFLALGLDENSVTPSMASVNVMHVITTSGKFYLRSNVHSSATNFTCCAPASRVQASIFGKANHLCSTSPITMHFQPDEEASCALLQLPPHLLSLVALGLPLPER